MEVVTIPDNLDHIKPQIIRHKLSVPVIASYLFKGYSQVEIARIHNVSRQAVDEYIDNHQDEFADLIDYEVIMPSLIKHNNLKIEQSLDDTELLKKASLLQRRTTVAIGIDKHQLLEGKSTVNLQIETQAEALIQLISKLQSLQVGENDQNMIDVTPVNDDPVPPTTISYVK